MDYISGLQDPKSVRPVYDLLGHPGFLLSIAQRSGAHIKYKKSLNPTHSQLYFKVRDTADTCTNSCESFKYIFISCNSVLHNIIEIKYIFMLCSSVFDHITEIESQKM